jgi:hypothetical protein
MRRSGIGLRWTGLAAALVLGVGCASTRTFPPPTNAQLGAAETNVKEARALGAADDPAAARNLRLAEQQLVLAKERAATNDNLSAAMLLARADADAEVAALLARRSRSVQAAALTEQHLAEARGEGTPATPAATPPVAPR